MKLSRTVSKNFKCGLKRLLFFKRVFQRTLYAAHKVVSYDKDQDPINQLNIPKTIISRQVYTLNDWVTVKIWLSGCYEIMHQPEMIS